MVRVRAVAVLCCVLSLALSGEALRLGDTLAAASAAAAKLDPLSAARATQSAGRSRVIVRAVDATSLAALVPVISDLGGVILRTLPIITAHAADLPNTALLTLADMPAVARISLDRPVIGSNERTGATVGANAVRQELGYDGAGVGIALIDSGVTPWHDDLAAPEGGQRVARFVDFVNGFEAPYDDFGHGTHVAGIVAGNGFDSHGARTGLAPAATLVVFKVLDSAGRGYISQVIAALDYILSNHGLIGIRIVNLSLAAGVFESYNTDPLTLAARRVVDAGLVVVAAAGNHGRTADGYHAYGGVTAPGNAPWVLTVGASSHLGTVTRDDDRMAAFSSRGPTAHDASAKPDLVAPGVGIESLSNPDSAFYSTYANYLLSGTVPTAYLPYLSLSGTSMSSPVVTGTVALMLQANPALTPNAVKGILQFTAQTYQDYDPLTQGAGFLNAAGAVELARLVAQGAAERPLPAGWSGHVIWGNTRYGGGWITAGAPAWSNGVTWGASAAASGEPIAWSSWRATPRNVVWGSACGGDNCTGPWTLSAATSSDESVVWGTAQEETVVWGTAEDDSVVWGTTASDESVVWGTGCADPSCEPVVWRDP